MLQAFETHKRKLRTTTHILRHFGDTSQTSLQQLLPSEILA